MKIQQYIQAKCEVQRMVLQFLDDENHDEENFSEFLSYFKDRKNDKYWNNFEEKLHLLLTIINNYKPSVNMYNKIEQIFVSIQDDIKQNLSDFEIFQFFKSNKLIILCLFEHKIIFPDRAMFNYAMKNKKEKISSFLYFFPEFKNYFYSKMKMKKKVNGIIYNLTKINVEDPNYFEAFDRLRKIGQNDLFICEIIRNDLIDDFIVYISQTNLDLLTTIKQSMFETNEFLLKRETNLIEYAAFFGSIKIFKYLLIKNVELTPSLWLYSIHSRNAEIMQILEENNIEFPHNFLKELLKIHDFQTTDYFLDNNALNKYRNKYSSKSIKYCNYSYYPNIDLTDQSALYYYNKYCYFDFIEMLEKENHKFSTVNFEKMKNLKKVLIQTSSISSIPMNAFSHCTNLTEIILPISLKSIESSAFEFCCLLTKITIPSSVEMIGENCFRKCSSLKNVIIDKNSKITSIKKYTFDLCKSLEQITIPSVCKTIEDFAFSRCYSLRIVNIPKSVTSFGPYSFYSCSKLEKVSFEIPSSFSKIGDSCFRDCISLTQMWIPYSITSIGNLSFFYCISCNVHVPNSLNSIGCNSIYKCKSCSRF